jgi:hypothetical protein
MPDLISELQETERECLQKFANRAAKLMATDPRLTVGIARAKAIEAMPNTCTRFWQCRAQLTTMGVKPINFEDL